LHQQPTPVDDARPLGRRYRVGMSLRRRATGIAVALALEAILLIGLFTLGGESQPGEPDGPRLATFDASNTPEAPDTLEPEEAAPEPETRPERVPPDPQPAPEAQPQPAAVPQQNPVAAAPALIPLARGDLARADITPRAQRPAAPPAASQPAYGPPNTGNPSDTERVGTAPNGEPLYAARWYREPTDGELAGYLSTATPGWALIACKTAPGYRVEDCVSVGESPGSQMARAVLAAAWQFRVRPPRLGGRDRIGEWVRIRIDYTVTRR
jgi:protein TonB